MISITLEVKSSNMYDDKQCLITKNNFQAYRKLSLIFHCNNTRHIQ